MFLINQIGGGNLYEKAASFQLLASKCQCFVFVGKMSFQVMHALGVSVPLDLVDQKGIDEALDIVRLAKDRNVQILYPKDFWCRSKCDPKQLQVFPSHGILNGELLIANRLCYSDIARHDFIQRVNLIHIWF